MARSILPAFMVVLYLRMSSSKQDKSISAQRDELLKLAKAKGYKVVREYVDEAISGDDTDKRTGFLKLRKDCENGPDFSIILVWHEDRFSRNDPLEYGYWLKPIRDSGVVLETPTGRVDWESLGGRLLSLIGQEMRHDYLRQLSRNVARGQLAAAKSGGGGTGGASPVGYKRKGGEILVDPYWAEIVQRIFTEYLKAGASLRSVTNLLNSENVPSSRGKRWQLSTVRDVLRNRKYTGCFVRFKRQEGKFHSIVAGEIVSRRKTDRTGRAEPMIVERRFEAIIDQRTFDKAQRKLLRRRGHTAHRTGHQYVFSGLLRCGDCGGIMGGAIAKSGIISGTKGRRSYSVYRCQTFHVHGRSACHCNGVGEAALLDVVLRKIQVEVFSDKAIDRLLVAYRKRLAARQQTLPADDSKVRRRIEDLDRQIDQGLDRVLRAPESLVGTLYGKIDKLRQERERLQADLSAIGQSETGVAVLDDAKVDEAARILRDIREAFSDAKPEEIRDLISPLVSKIELHYRHVPNGKKERNFLQGGTIFVRPTDPALSLMFGSSGTSP